MRVAFVTFGRVCLCACVRARVRVGGSGGARARARERVCSVWPVTLCTVLFERVCLIYVRAVALVVSLSAVSTLFFRMAHTSSLLRGK